MLTGAGRFFVKFIKNKFLEPIFNGLRYFFKLTRSVYAKYKNELIDETEINRYSGYATSSNIKMNDNNICQLIIEKYQNRDNELFRINSGQTVRVGVGATLYGQKISFYINLPIKENVFSRNDYREIKFEKGKGGIEYFDLTDFIPGTFHYYFTVCSTENKCGSGYILVEPNLRDLHDGNIIPLDSIRCVTVLSKCLGKFDEWLDRLNFTNATAYNIIHFTPVQELGASGSCYSIKDQLQVNTAFSTSNQNASWKTMKNIISEIKNKYKMFSICDIVLNHTSFDSEWISEHPECAFNLENSPHLRPAYVLDLALHKLTLDIVEDNLESKGIPTSINSEKHLNALKFYLESEILPKLKLEEFYIIDVNQLLMKFQEECLKMKVFNGDNIEYLDELKIIQDPYYKRLKSSIDLDLAVQLYNIYWTDCFDEDTRLKRCCLNFKNKLEELNKTRTKEINEHLTVAINNIIAHVKYHRIQSDGPKIEKVSLKDPLVPRYFSDYQNSSKTEEEIFDCNNKYIFAHNGWTMNDDPLKNFAEKHSNVYLRRELIAWGDSIKLRYGDSASDCPYLWNRMKTYVDRTAEIFNGIRLDNCHSTPIHVAEYFLDSARQINPNLYVVAELFTNSDETDNIFVNKLGISSLIREGLSAWNARELGRLVYRFGGRPVGSLKPTAESNIAHALFLDLTHDNDPNVIEKRCVYDLLPSSALISMAACATGSTLGYDQLVPHHINVVTEDRLYNKNQNELNIGIMNGKRFLNKLHAMMSQENFNQVFVDQITEDIVCITRHNRKTLECIILIAYTSFCWPTSDQTNGKREKLIIIDGNVDELILEAYLKHKENNRFTTTDEFIKNKSFINGLTEYDLAYSCGDKNLNNSKLIELVPVEDNRIEIYKTKDFLPGSVVAMKIVPGDKVKHSIMKLNENFDLSDVVNDLNFNDLNHALFKCKNEEERGMYEIPNFGIFVFAGLQGLMSVVNEIIDKDDLGHPFCTNIRNGNWLAEYTVDRLLNYKPTITLGKKLKDKFDYLINLPAGDKPYYFCKIIEIAYSALRDRVFDLMPKWIQSGDELTQALALASVQMLLISSNSKLPSLNYSDDLPIMAAGLPHFSNEYMRSWGRDTFISLRGLLLLTGCYQDAKNHILSYAGCLRHGLIPNLLDSGINPRYNCRDAVWWWLYSIQNYYEFQDDNLLNETVNRLYPHDDSDGKIKKEQKLFEVVQEVMNTHFQGLCFSERNAGTQIDQHMTNLGFDNQIGVHPETGFVFGGNEWNCGTWMDKMGSSVKAGTKGKPATPRDGSAIEIVSLAYSTIKWLNEMNFKKSYPYGGVTRVNKDGREITWTWAEWRDKIKINFENKFWIDQRKHDDDSEFINKRGIYKDTVNSTNGWSDYQLRPNYLIALVVAKDLFDVEHAKIALENTKKYLLGPLGVKTLNEDDWAYNGYYDNSNDTDDSKVAQGFNYHQGPEWLWPMGYYLRGLLHYFADKINKDGLIMEIKMILSNHLNYVKSSPWRSLPELTNANGEFCEASCPSQAWSIATILEALYDLNESQII